MPYRTPALDVLDAETGAFGPIQSRSIYDNLARTDPDFSRVYNPWRTLMDQYTAMLDPNWARLQAEKKSQEITSQARPSPTGGTTYPLDPRDRSGGTVFTPETAYSFGLSEAERQRNETRQQVTALGAELSREETRARNAGKIQSGVAPIPFMAPGTDVAIGFLKPDGTPEVYSAAAFLRLNGPDANALETTRRSIETADRTDARTAFTESQANARNAQTTAASRARTEQQAHAAELVNQVARDRLALELKQGLNKDLIDQKKLTEAEAYHNTESFIAAETSSRERLNTWLREASNLDDRTLSAWAKQGDWDEKETQRAATYLNQIQAERHTEDVESYKGAVSSQNERISSATQLAKAAQQAFLDTLKDYVPYRTGTDEIVQRGLVAIAAGRQVPRGFQDAFTMPASFPQDVAAGAASAGEAAFRRYMDRPAGSPMYPDAPAMNPRAPLGPAPSMIRVPQPQGYVTPELLDATAMAGVNQPDQIEAMNRVRARGQQDPQFQGTVNDLIGIGDLAPGSYGAGAGYPTPSLPSPDLGLEPTASEPAPVEMPTPVDFTPEPPPEESNYFGDQGFQTGPDIQSRQDDPQFDPIVMKMDEVFGQYLEPEDHAGTAVAIASVYAGEDPKDAWNNGFPNGPDWSLGDDYGLGDYYDWGAG